MAEIKLQKRYKYAGDIMPKLLDIDFDLETASDFLNSIPDADVVPRAELDYWKQQAYDGCMDKQRMDEKIKELEKRLSELPREIFEEIGKYMMDVVVTHTAYKRIGTSTFAILKKKYTEGQK